MSTVADIGAVLSDVERVVVVSHVHPDGDAVGSTLSMGLVLEAIGKVVTFYNRDPIPYNFRFLPGASKWTSEWPSDADCVVMLDCGEPRRVGDLPASAWQPTVVVVDHHKTYDPDFADHYLRDVDAAATGELVFRLAEHFGVMTPDIAHNIYCCLMTDTGSFRYSNTSKATFTIAGALIEAGVDAWYMTSHIYESEPRERLELLGSVLQTLTFSPCKRLAFLRIEQSMLDEYGCDGSMIDGFINYARSIRGVEVATQLLEADDEWRISFRSRGAVDVSQLAARFGGGGHHNAAGCSVNGAPEEVEAQLATALVEMLDG